jgi:hypothetical protein
MRSLIVPAGSLLALLAFSVPSHGWIFHRHVHRHVVAYGQPMAQPLTLGFQLPGGVHLNTQFDGSILQRLRSGGQDQRQPAQQPARLTVDPDVRDSINRIETNVNGALTKLNKLTNEMNKRLAKDQQFPEIIAERPTKTEGGGAKSILGTKKEGPGD